MRVPFFHVDAFASARFAGNPAAVMPLDRFPPDELLQRVAAENALPETAFLVPAGEEWHLRWFTPKVEVPLCGHATLAAAWVVTERLRPGTHQVVFHTRSGLLRVERTGERFRMDFPQRRNIEVAEPAGLAKALGVKPLATWHDGFNFVALLDGAQVIRELAPDLAAIERLVGAVGVIVTAAGDRGYDCVSRYFAPAKGIQEDPVTGGAHCGLAPWWAARLGKSEIRGYQASVRGGEVLCRVKGDRVELEGGCVFYSEGFAEV